MTIEFGKNHKQRLVDTLGGELIESNSAMLTRRGGERLRIEFTGFLEGERRLGFRLICDVNRGGEQEAGPLYRQDPRPRVQGLPALRLRRETQKDRKGKRWKLNREVQTGDAGFDDLVYVDSGAPDDHLDAVLGSRETRRIVESLFTQHCETIDINERPGKLAVAVRAHVPDDDSLPRLIEELKERLDDVISLKTSLPLFVGNSRAVRRHPLLRWGYYVQLLLLLTAVIGAIAADSPVDDWPVLMLVGGGLGAVVLFVPLAWLLAHGHNRGAMHFRGLLALAIFAFPLIALGLGIGSNDILDTSQPQLHRVLVLDHPTYHKGKRWVRVRDYRNKRFAFNVRIGRRAYNNAKPGDTLLITVHAGFWGWPMVTDARLTDTAEPSRAGAASASPGAKPRI